MGRRPVEAGVQPAEATGLTSAQAALRLAADGPNTLPGAERPHPLVELGRQLVGFFAVMLWVAAGLAWLAGTPELAVAIAVVVLRNGGFAFAQERRADQAAERLRDLLPARATVRRDGRAQVVDVAGLVVGDVLLLAAGDRVPADVRLLPGGPVEVDESMLTGESAARSADPVGAGALFAGTYLVEGACEAAVVAVGAATRLAGIAAVTRSAVRPPSPLARQLHRVVRLVAVIAVTVGVGFFGVSLLLGEPPQRAYLFAIGVTVALVPEGLLPTVTLSLARAAQRMAAGNALVRHLEAVETLGATTFICTDKTGTLTRNQMSVVECWTADGVVQVRGAGYEPDGTLTGGPSAVRAVALAADSARRCSPDAHALLQGSRWVPVGDPMDVALHVLATRVGVTPAPRFRERYPFDPRRRRSSVVDADGTHVVGAPDAVLRLCPDAPPAAAGAVAAMAERGLRVLAVASRAPDGDVSDGAARTPPGRVDQVERDLTLLALVGLQDPPRDDVTEAIEACRTAGIRIAMVTGDHPVTALTIARQVHLVRGDPLVVVGEGLPTDDEALGALLDRDDVVVARVTPEDKLRIARALQGRGHVVAMTGDGVNDGPALRTADIGVAMGASGTDVAREAADLVLLDDHFGSIVGAIELGRATFANIRRFLTYHLTDNVAELTPFAVWALSGGRVPLAITVLQVLALDIGTDLLPALALGAERPSPRTMTGALRRGPLLDARVLGRAFGVLGPAEAVTAMTGFVVVLLAGGWSPGTAPEATLLATASGTAFAAIVLGQLANAFACRSESRWVGAVGLRGNPLLLVAVVVEVVMLLTFLGLPPLVRLLGGGMPDAVGWLLASAAIPAVWAADSLMKWVQGRDRSAGVRDAAAPGTAGRGLRSAGADTSP